jgi:predicted molibdopterin-dependent oxidoreductase YjgC
VGDKGNLLEGVEPSTEHIVAQGQLCIKGLNAFHFVNHPERLTRPMIRTNGKLSDTSWDQAIELAVGKLQEIQKKHGPDALAFFSSAKTTNEENYLMMKLARAVFKTNNIDHCARLCHSSTVVGLASTLGSGAMTNSISCIDQTDCIFVTGSNTTEQHPLIGSRIIKAKQAGAKLIVADNRTIRLARIADMHIRWQNGTDVAFLNGIMNVIISEGLEDTPQEIINAARMFAKAKKAMIIYSMGITQHTHGVDNVKSCANLAMLTGNVGMSGTGVNPLRGQNNVQGACDMGALPNVYTGYQKVEDEQVRKKFEKAWGVQELPAKAGFASTTAIDMAAEGKLKAIYVMGENPMVSHADQTHVRKALEKLELLIVQDIFPTDTSQLADIILPATSYAEKDGTFTSTERRVQRVRRAIEPIGQSRPDWRILCDIASRGGYHGMQYTNPSEIMDEIASVTAIYGGISFERIDQTGLQWPCSDEEHPGTPVLHSGRFARGFGLFSPAQYRPSAELPDSEYPFLLSTGRCYFHFHTGTMTRRTRLLDREEPCPYVEMHPDDSKGLGIRNRQWIYVRTRRGEIKTRARVTNSIKKGILFMPFHFKEAPANRLTHNVLDPVAKIPEYKVCAAQVRIAE